MKKRCQHLARELIRKAPKYTLGPNKMREQGRDSKSGLVKWETPLEMKPWGAKGSTML